MGVAGPYRCAFLFAFSALCGLGCDSETSPTMWRAQVQSEVFYQLTSGSGGRVLEFSAPDRGVIASVRVTGADPIAGLAPDTEYWQLAPAAAQDLSMGYLGQLRVAALDDTGGALSFVSGTPKRDRADNAREVMGSSPPGDRAGWIEWTVPRRFRLDADPSRLVTAPAASTVVYGLETADGERAYFLQFQFIAPDAPPVVDWFLVGAAYDAVATSAKHAGASVATFDEAAVDFGAGADVRLVKTALGHRYVPLF